jgi:outer membrane protein OmpA-like peptidoglycan-associated protein
VQITGHTDTVGSTADNDVLSLKRAGEIREALAVQGLNLTITRAVGRGERELLVPTPDNTAEPRNRRVEIIVR